jgi:hypothetical protein
VRVSTSRRPQQIFGEKIRKTDSTNVILNLMSDVKAMPGWKRNEADRKTTNKCKERNGDRCDGKHRQGRLRKDENSEWIPYV